MAKSNTYPGGCENKDYNRQWVYRTVNKEKKHVYLIADTNEDGILLHSKKGVSKENLIAVDWLPDTIVKGREFTPRQTAEQFGCAFIGSEFSKVVTAMSKQELDSIGSFYPDYMGSLVSTHKSIRDSIAHLISNKYSGVFAFTFVRAHDKGASSDLQRLTSLNHLLFDGKGIITEKNLYTYQSSSATSKGQPMGTIKFRFKNGKITVLLAPPKKKVKATHMATNTKSTKKTARKSTPKVSPGTLAANKAWATRRANAKKTTATKKTTAKK
jgi:hypothetical protein